MQISGAYSAPETINAIDPTQRTGRRAPRSGARGGDTVSISEEALALFRQSSRADRPEADADDTGAKFRQALAEAWSDTESGEGSLFAKIRSALFS